MQILVKRSYKNRHTDGKLYINGLDDDHFFCHVLEDVGRPSGVKIDGETCIPEGIYYVCISRSARWGKDMLLLYNDHTTKYIDRDGVVFSGIRPHGGNNTKDTHGCPLVAYNSDEAGAIWNSASGDLFERVKQAIDDLDVVTWVVFKGEDFK